MLQLQTCILGSLLVAPLLTALPTPRQPASCVSTTYHLDPATLLTPGPPRYTATAPPLIRRQSPPTTTTIQNTSISFDWYCTSTPTRCSNAQSSFIRALTRIALGIYLPSGLSISISFTSFCESDPSRCGQNGTTLGSAAPSAWHVWQPGAGAKLGVDEAYSYPRALARQYAPDDPALAGGYDVDANLNADVKWWFSGADGDWVGEGDGKAWWRDGGGGGGEGGDDDGSGIGTMGNNKAAYDFEQVAVHEILHGLGFISSWFPWIDQDVLLPAPMDNYPNGTVGADGLQKPYIFNRWLSDATTGVWMKEYEDAIYAAARAALADGNTTDGWQQRFMASEGWQLGANIMKSVATTPGALRLWFPVRREEGLGLGYSVLYTPSKFNPGSSFSHLDAQHYDATRQFLMRPYATYGAGVDAILPSDGMVNNEGPGPMGEEVLGILRGLGYVTSLGPLQ
ncbi:hypothetical protein HK104_010137 [Borealophlyctis nickersoniae]|nr:hypothetical protein HK104_010137 [Borealophlyctis nickersoniae]